jgi:hypothetical protein
VTSEWVHSRCCQELGTSARSCIRVVSTFCVDIFVHNLLVFRVEGRRAQQQLVARVEAKLACLVVGEISL